MCSFDIPSDSGTRFAAAKVVLNAARLGRLSKSSHPGIQGSCQVDKPMKTREALNHRHWHASSMPRSLRSRAEDALFGK